MACKKIFMVLELSLINHKATESNHLLDHQ